MGKKKKQKRDDTTTTPPGPEKDSALEKQEPAAAAPPKKQEDKEAVALTAAAGSPTPAADEQESSYMAAAVVFFTRCSQGSVSKVLVAVEDRKVQASYIGLTQKGKVSQRMLVFPMGRKEKKDKNDPVETAKREYVEETGDFGGLSRYLDFADFGGEDSDEDADKGDEDLKIWKGTGNMALNFPPASMVALFCEVPAAAADCDERRAEGGVALHEEEDGGLPPGTELVGATPRVVAAAAGTTTSTTSATDNATAAAAGAAAAAGNDGAETSASTTGKKRKRERGDGCKPLTYIPGKTDHLAPAWVDASSLREALVGKERAPSIQIEGEDEGCRLFPTSLALLKLPEARAWLGAPSVDPETVEPLAGKAGAELLAGCA